MISHKLRIISATSLTDKDTIWSCSDVLGLEQLPFEEYSRNRKTIIKADVLKEFGSNV